MDHDASQIDGTYTSLFRGSQRVLISGNSFNSTAESNAEAGTSNECIRIDGTENDANPVKGVFIVGNVARVHSAFFKLLGVNSSLPNPHENVIISNNQIMDRELVDNSTGIIQLTGNVAVTNSGLRNCLIYGNFIGALNTGSAGGHEDVRVNTTGFAGFVVRDNWFSNDGVSNITNYTNVFGNFANPDSMVVDRRDSNAGTATITSTDADTQVVSHGVGYTPTLDNIKVVPTNSMGNASNFWITSPTATQFTIKTNVAVGTGNSASFAWCVSRGIVV
jgi:hypothetical protein